MFCVINLDRSGAGGFLGASDVQIVRTRNISVRGVVKAVI